MNGRRVLLAGCGDLGCELGLRLRAHGAEVWGLRRNTDALPDGITPLAADLGNPASLAALRGQAFDHVVITLTPVDYSDEAYRIAYVEGLRNLLGALDTRPGWTVFVSSTGVYHQDDHGWVDESSPTEPTAFSGMRMLEAENVLRGSGLPAVSVRLSGIYGPGRTRVIDQVRAGSACGPEDRLYTNRIHREDAVGFLEHLILRKERGEPVDDLYICTDSFPVTMWDVQSWIATKLGMDPFGLKTGPMPGRTSKRCRNTRMRESGYELVYPDYMTGYGELLEL